MNRKENIRYCTRNTMSMNKEMPPKSVHVEMRLAKQKPTTTHQSPVHFKYILISIPNL